MGFPRQEEKEIKKSPVELNLQGFFYSIYFITINDKRKLIKSKGINSISNNHKKKKDNIKVIPPYISLAIIINLPIFTFPPLPFRLFHLNNNFRYTVRDFYATNSSSL